MPITHSDYLDFLDAAKLHKPAFGPTELIEDFQKLTNRQPPGHAVSFLLDFSRKKYLTMSNGTQEMLGYSPGYVKDGGLDLIVSGYHSTDANIYFGDIFLRNLHFLRQLPGEDHPGYLFSYNYRFKDRGGQYRSILQRFSIIQSAADNTPLVMAAFLTDITHFKTDSRIVHTIERIGANGASLVYKNVYAASEEDEILTKRETEVLKYICAGFSSKQIADKMHLSIHTIHNHRKNMLEKTNSGNVAELMNYAIRHHLL
ncbi:MAG: hypothetical protein DI535_20985 [Citrobacter freundii]|nr:MAG: hypothetical protein DI535_20985 [Citrobacter freundii]